MSRRGAPGWVYRERMALSEASHQSQYSSLQAEIRKLRNEKDELIKRIQTLEKENEELKKANI